MNEVINKIKVFLKKPKLLIAVGIFGIALLLFSSLLGGDKSDSVKSEINSIAEAEEYRKTLEADVLKIVKSISGDKKATVVITLENGIKYSYADSFNSQSSNSSGTNTKNESNSSSKTYLTVRGDDGGENPLIITEIMPEVRGVAIVCEGGDDAALAEKISKAVMSALNITSKRVYIVGGSNYEKR
jgi:stage III sporulation protein AG